MINLFCIRPQGFNVGNDVIFLGLQHFLREAFGSVVNLISLPATARYESQAKAGLTAKTIYEINQYGHGVIVGGGNLYENGELEVSLDALRSLEVPLLLFSLSQGRIYNRLGQLVPRTDAMPARTIQALHEKAQISLARDQATHGILKRIGCHQATLGGCPSIFVDRLTDRLPSLAECDRHTVLVSIRHPALMNISLSRQAQVREDILGILAFLRQEGYQDVRLLCHDHRDLSFAASFQNVDYVYTGDVYTYLALLRSCALNVTYRLHSFLPCLSFGTPTIKISYDERALSLLETVGYGSWNIDMVRQPNVLAQVRNRHQRLKELHELRAQAKGCWKSLEQTMTDSLGNFAHQVRQCRAEQAKSLVPLDSFPEASEPSSAPPEYSRLQRAVISETGDEPIPIVSP